MYVHMVEINVMYCYCISSSSILSDERRLDGKDLEILTSWDQLTSHGLSSTQNKTRNSYFLLIIPLFLKCSNSKRIAEKLFPLTDPDSPNLRRNAKELLNLFLFRPSRAFLTLKQTQREKGSVMMTTNHEMEVRSQPHIPIPGSGSSLFPPMAGSSCR